MSTSVLTPEITFRGMSPDAKLEEQIRGQLAKLARFYGRVITSRVLVEKMEGRRKGNPYHVRIALGLPQTTLVVEHEPSLYATAKDKADSRVSKKLELHSERKTAARAVHDAFDEMRRRLQDYARKQRGAVKVTGQPQQSARVVELIPEDNYGFCATEDGRRVYFHRNSLVDGRLEGLRIGSKVRFVEEQGDKGPQASTVHLVRPRTQAELAAKTVLAPRAIRKAAPRGAKS